MRTKIFFSVILACIAIVVSRSTARAGEYEFKYKAADAQSVELMCEHNGWKGIQMSKGDDGVWKTKVDLSPGTYAYKFLVNGKDWVMDPDATTKKSVDNIENSAVEIK